MKRKTKPYTRHQLCYWESKCGVVNSPLGDEFVKELTGLNTKAVSFIYIEFHLVPGRFPKPGGEFWEPSDPEVRGRAYLEAGYFLKIRHRNLSLEKDIEIVDQSKSYPRASVAVYQFACFVTPDLAEYLNKKAKEVSTFRSHISLAKDYDGGYISIGHPYFDPAKIEDMANDPRCPEGMGSFFRELVSGLAAPGKGK